MTGGTPEAAVVVATRNRADRLQALLHSLAFQRGPRFETVIVDDASTDRTPALLADPPAELELRAVRHASPLGPAAARNAGWRAARAPLVAFVDDDVVAEPGFVAAYVEAHRDEPGAVLQGRTEFDPEELSRSGAFWRSIKVDGPDPFYPTCNIAYPRELLVRLGGFDDHYRRPAGEDTDLGWRARERGATTRFVDDARVRHAVHQMGVISMVRDAARLADNVRVLKRHPGLRVAYHRRLFWQPAHERLLLLLAGLTLAGRSRGLTLALGIPYALIYRRYHRRWAGALASLPGYAAVDLAQVAWLARASVRYRTLVL